MSALHPHRHTGASDQERDGDRRRLTLAVLLTSGYLFAEVIGGLWTGSLALLADAGHMLSDVGSLALALAATVLSRRPPSSRRTYGFHRAEVLAAGINGLLLVVVAVWIVIEALERLRQPPEVLGGAMLLIALGGLAVNLAVLKTLHGAHRHSLNLEGAWLHVIGDALGSVGAITSGLLLWLFDWRLADPIASLLIAVLVLASAVSLIRKTAHVLMEGAPSEPGYDEVIDELCTVDGVASVHDLHIWTLGHGRRVLTAHLVKKHGGISGAALLEPLQQRLAQRFGLDHVTLQVESPPGCECDCSLEEPDEGSRP